MEKSKLLLVDDEPNLTSALVRSLDRTQFEIFTADSAQQALTLLDRSTNAGMTVSLLISDLHMPDMDGFQLVSAVRDRSAFAALPVLMLTSSASPGDQAQSQTLGIAARLLKPVPADKPAVSAGVAAARERIDDDPAETLTLGDLAAGAGLSRYQFLRAFTRLTGLPPHAYLLQRRIQHARALVRSGMALADAAAASGFADQSHMTRCFARSFGLTPGSFAPR